MVFAKDKKREKREGKKRQETRVKEFEIGHMGFEINA